MKSHYMVGWVLDVFSLKIGNVRRQLGRHGRKYYTMKYGVTNMRGFIKVM
jgi:hypothetical protein